MREKGTENNLIVNSTGKIDRKDKYLNSCLLEIIYGRQRQLKLIHPVKIVSVHFIPFLYGYHSFPNSNSILKDIVTLMIVVVVNYIMTCTYF